MNLKLLRAGDALCNAEDVAKGIGAMIEMMEGSSDRVDIKLKDIAELIRVAHMALNNSLDEIRKNLS